MKITISSIALLVLFSLTGYSQSNYFIKGSAIDTAEKRPLPNTTIMVLNAKDSVLRKFTRAAEDGSFVINNLEKGKFVMVVSNPGYADYTEGFTLDESVQLSHDFGKISMLLKSRLLKDVIIKGTATAIKIKGDTTEFNARAYVIQPNDRVEDLIKQFPGIQVDKDGKITAQGQEVKKVLVDGEEFFGDDPTLVTKNLRADMVDKVQLYDKKSDQATFTGIDDGEKTKTLNIKLKENKKSGYFGRLDAGIGNAGFYSGQGMFNKFTAKQKLSLYTTNANTGKTGLGWQDNQKFGDSGGMQMNDDGGMMFYFSGSDDGLDSFSGRYDGRGIPKATTGGVHYDTKWGGDKQTLNANYKIGKLDIDGTSNTLTQNNQPGDLATNKPPGVINTNADQAFHNAMFRQKFDLAYMIKMDTTATLKITADGTYKDGKTATNFSSSSRRGDGSLLNKNDRGVDNDEISHLFNASTFYTKKLKKKGRTLSVLVSEAVTNGDTKGFLKSSTAYYNTAGALDSIQAIDQQKTDIIRNTVFNSNITYTEPLTKKLSLIFNYGLNLNNGTSDRRSFNSSSPGNYDLLDLSLSNDYKLNQLSNQGGLTVNYKSGKITVNFGAKASDVSFKQTDVFTGTDFKRHFVNWNPQANFQFRFSEQGSLYANYNGSTRQPSINQIQPIKVNTDPLNIFIGNAALRPSFSHRFNLNYYSYKVLSSQNIWMGANFSMTENQIVNNTLTDITSGKSTTQYINLTNKSPYNYGLYGEFSRKIDPFGVNVGIDLNMNGNRNYGYTNGVLTSSNSGNYNAKFTLSKWEKNKYDFYMGVGPSYNVSNSSLQTGTTNNGRGFSGNATFNITLPLQFEIGSNVDYTYTAKTATFNEDYRRTLLNATITKAFFKAKTLKLSVSGNDLLNQNSGFDRNAYGNIISQESYTTIKRYFMFSVSWDFSQMGGSDAKK
jgi:hypothetical protein